MKTLALLILSSFMLFGYSVHIQQATDELAGQSGAPFMKPEKHIEVNGSDSIRPSAATSISERKDSVVSGMNSQQVSSSSDNRGPGIPLFDFSGAEPSWYIVNDNVMGGVSKSSVFVDPELQRLSFSGAVSLENNGGFASTRSQWTGYDLSAFDGIALRVRGDGNTYRFRIRTEETGFGIAYTGLFKTGADAWQEIYIPFSETVPLYRGFVVNAAGPLDPESIRSFGLMLADKQQGKFSLDVDWINAVAESKYEIRYANNAAEYVQVIDSAYLDS